MWPWGNVKRLHLLPTSQGDFFFYFKCCNSGLAFILSLSAMAVSRLINMLFQPTSGKSPADWLWRTWLVWMVSPPSSRSLYVSIPPLPAPLARRRGRWAGLRWVCTRRWIVGTARFWHSASVLPCTAHNTSDPIQEQNRLGIYTNICFPFFCTVHLLFLW